MADMSILSKVCVNALSRANPISTKQMMLLMVVRFTRVNALNRANPISTCLIFAGDSAGGLCQCP